MHPVMKWANECHYQPWSFYFQVHRNTDGSLSLKLADFGLAMELKDLIYTVCGTPTYVAPEILEEKGILTLNKIFENELYGSS